MLTIHNLTKKFGDNQVLKGVDLSVDKGDVIAIIGQSGGGKTTLLRCINFLETADSGSPRRTFSVSAERRPSYFRAITCFATRPPCKM